MTQPAGTTPRAEAAPAAPETTTAPRAGAAAAAAEPSPPRPGIRALIDNATANRLYGWAWDASAPDRRLTVELRLGEATVASAVADLARPDLAGNGIGDGCHAFEFPLRPEWVERRGELSAVVLGGNGAETPVAVRIRRPDDAKVSTQLQRAMESLAAEHAALRKEVEARPDPAAAVRDRLDQLELWIARLDAKLGEDAAPRAAGKAGGGGIDPWQAALAAVLAGAASAALALAVAWAAAG